jgi:hypothetical protein
MCDSSENPLIIITNNQFLKEFFIERDKIYTYTNDFEKQFFSLHVPNNDIHYYWCQFLYNLFGTLKRIERLVRNENESNYIKY